MPETNSMTDDALASALAEQERVAVSWRDTVFADEQALSLDYYESAPLGNEEEGRSKVVTRDVQEVVDAMTISVMRTCVSGDNVVEFEALRAEDEQGAAEATSAINHMFMRRQDGDKVLIDFLQSGLIEKIGIVKPTCLKDQKVVREQGVLTEDQLMMLDAETVESSQPNEDGTYSVVVAQTEMVKRYVDLPVPSEEFLFLPKTRHEDEADYLAHRRKVTLSELVEMGFDRAKVESLPADTSDVVSDWRSINRWGGISSIEVPAASDAQREVELLEEYVRIDRNGDGIAERLCVHRVGNVILSIEDADFQPFVVFCPFPRAHRMVGDSLADKVMDVQLVRSTLLRQTLDGIALTNSPRTWLPQESVTDETLDDLLTVGPGVVVRGRGAAPTMLSQAFDVSKSMTLMEFMVGEKESRTGITRMNQGLDADALNKTATGTAMMQAAGQQVEEYVARNFANALGRLFMKKLQIIKAEGGTLSVKIDGQYKDVDPSIWSDDMAIAINVGLGSGRKEQRLAYRMQLLQVQREALDQGLATPKMLYNNATALVRDAALGQPQDYFLDPESPEAEEYRQSNPPQPSPEQQKAQAEVQKFQADAQVKLQIANDRLEFDRERAAAEMALAREKMDREFALAQFKISNAPDLSSDRPGGSLAA